MRRRLYGAFLDFGSLGPDVDTRVLDRTLQMEYYTYSAGEDVPDRLRGCQVAIVHRTRLSRPILYSSPGLELVVIAGPTVEHVDLAAARDRGIVVTQVQDFCEASVVQHVFALILALTRQILPFDRLVRSGGWQRNRATTLIDQPMRDLTGRTLGIVGYGRIGSAVATMAEQFGMKVLIAARPGTRRSQVPEGRIPFKTLLRQVDILSLHCPMTEDTRNLVGPEQLARMKSDALLINTSRGGLIDFAALLAALRSGQLAGAALDVLPEEPPSGQYLQLLAEAPPNLIVTPHVAWAAVEARQRALVQAAENITDYLSGGTLRRIV